MDLSGAVLEWATAIGADGPVAVLGGGTGWELGGPVDPGARVLSAPAEHVDHRPAELTVEVDAGVTLGALRGVLAESGQRTVLAGPDTATVGGALAVGRSGVDRRGDGPLRDALLGAQVVGSDGRPFVAGGATVKNVSGYDLCRALVGSLGTLACLGRVVLRTLPIAECDGWWQGEADPFPLARALWRPAAVLWDGSRTWVHLRGGPDLVEEQRRIAAEAGVSTPVDGPPVLPPHRWSLRPSELRSLSATDGAGGSFVAEVGVGVVHRHAAPPPRHADPVTQQLADALRGEFDPRRRLNPGRDPGRW